jgi:hypothetical protein
MAAEKKLRPRLLVIEDNPSRIELFRQWTKDGPYGLIETTSGGQAMGTLKFGSEGIAGVCLDHDLNSRPKTRADEWVSGSDVVNTIVAKLPRWVPILVHSMNVTHAPLMVKRLQGAGYTTTRIRMVALDQERFQGWLDEVTEQWRE